jgi:hypothetical protein
VPQVPEALLGEAALLLVRLDLPSAALLPAQLEAVLRAALWSPALQALDLTGAALEPLPGRLLADAAACLSSLSLCGARLATKQLAVLLQAVALPSSALDHLSLAALDLSEVPAGLLAASLATLPSLNLSYCRLAVDQVTALLRRLGRPGSRVQALELARVDLQPLPGPVLARALGPLHSLGLAYCSLTPEQALALVTACARGLSARTVRTDLRTVPVRLLLRACSGGRLVLRHARLTQEQRVALEGAGRLDGDPPIGLTDGGSQSVICSTGV